MKIFTFITRTMPQEMKNKVLKTVATNVRQKATIAVVTPQKSDFLNWQMILHNMLQQVLKGFLT